ncbi:MAG: PVC-type heme-binding CxxCH protein, partial [Verrucomicrobiales bacterium]
VFADIFTPTHDASPAADAASSSPARTTNGVHLTANGYRLLAPILERTLFGQNSPGDPPENLLAAIRAKAELFFRVYRPINAAYIHGPLREPFGLVDFPPEFVRLEDDIVAANEAIWLAASGEPIPTAPARNPAPTRSARPSPGNALLSPAQEAASFALAEGFEINCFASEELFPELRNPIQAVFDSAGRLWVATMPSYPHPLPGEEPNNKIIVLEDKDGDGVADHSHVFADGLHLPTGFELSAQGVYVAQAPELLLLRDRDSDGRADEKTILLRGFGTADGRNLINGFTWSPEGDLLFCEGSGLLSRIETPYGPVHSREGAIYRYNPHTRELDFHMRKPIGSPRGLCFERWGQALFTDADIGACFWSTPLAGSLARSPAGSLAPETATPADYRPTTAVRFVSSRNFPARIQGHLLVANADGFRGLLRYPFAADNPETGGSHPVSTDAEKFLASSDPSFRPVDLRFGPDGALYIVDWYNPVFSHRDQSLRDPARDHDHGRIWRVRHSANELLAPPTIEDAPLPALLELLKSPESATRYRTRRELSGRDAGKVVDALERWVRKLDREDQSYVHHLLEALWIYRVHDALDADLIEGALWDEDFNARAAATRLLRAMLGFSASARALLATQANDPHPAVRVEAAIAASHIDSLEGARIALEITKQPMDSTLETLVQETLEILEPRWKKPLLNGRFLQPLKSSGIDLMLRCFDADELLAFPRSFAAYQAFLRTPGIPPHNLHEALEVLASAHDTSALEELVLAIRAAEAAASPKTPELLAILRAMRNLPMPESSGLLLELHGGSRSLAVRRSAARALLANSPQAGDLLYLAEAHPPLLRDLLESTLSYPDVALSQRLRTPVLAWLDAGPDSAAARAVEPVFGRFVRLSAPSASAALALTELEVFADAKNVALGGAASQSSAWEQGAAFRAVDGNRTFVRHLNSRDKTFTITRSGEPDPWWQIDLGSTHELENIALWATGATRLGEGIATFKITVLNQQGQAIYTIDDLAPPHIVARFDLRIDPAIYAMNTAIRILPQLLSQPGDAFARVAAYLDEPLHRSAALEALRRIPARAWPAEQRLPLIHHLAAILEQTPAQERQEALYVNALALARDSLPLLDPGSELRARLAQQVKP